MLDPSWSAPYPLPVRSSTLTIKPFFLTNIALIGALALTGCSEAPPLLYGDAPIAGSGEHQEAPACGGDSNVGVPIAGRPGYPERTALYAADRARAEPGKTGWPDFPAVAPLLWHDELAQAAMAHSVDMRDTPCFQHDSCDGTMVFDRIKGYLKVSWSTLGENIAAGVPDPSQVIESSFCGAVNSPMGVGRDSCV